MKYFTRLALLSFFLLLPQGAQAVTVFAAASLTNSLQSVADRYEAKTGVKVTLSFSASSTLARQIEQGAPADIFISADEDWMDYLQKAGNLAPGSRRDLLGNSLVLIAPAQSPALLRIAPHFDLADALQGGRLALADPDSVPAGKYGRAALTALGVWDSVSDHLARAENVRAALEFVAHGEAPFGIVYATDARVEKGVRVVGVFPASSHPPIVYPMALTKSAPPEAKAFEDFLSGPQSHAIFQADGFTVLDR